MHTTLELYYGILRPLRGAVALLQLTYQFIVSERRKKHYMLWNKTDRRFVIRLIESISMTLILLSLPTKAAVQGNIIQSFQKGPRITAQVLSSGKKTNQSLTRQRCEPE